MRFDQIHEAILYEIEVGIIKIYKVDRELTDHNVNKAADALVRHYTADLKGRKHPKIRLTDLEQKVYDHLQSVCENWMEKEGEGYDQYDKPLIIDCLKRIQKSIRLWTTDYGMHGYLNFIERNVPMPSE